MFKRLMMALLGTSMVLMFATNAYATRLTGSAYFACLKIKPASQCSVHCLATAQAVPGSQISGGSAGQQCVIDNVTAAIIFCSNKPETGSQLHSAAASNIVIDFGSGFQVASDGNCDRKRGRCSYEATTEAAIIGQHHPACPNDNWSVIGVAPFFLDGLIRLIECRATNGKLVACDSDKNNQIDQGVTVVVVDTKTERCELLEPETFQPDERRDYSCVETP